MTYRLGVDVGGTFTDFVLHDSQSNRLEFAKTPSTPGNQAEGVKAGVLQLIKRLGLTPESISFFIHGTTVATNALLERKGAKTALIVTKGFRDVLQIGRQDRPDLYDWHVRRSDPIVPRRLRFEVAERVLHTGKVIEPVSNDDIAEIIQHLKDHKVEAVAVCLIHSYAYPIHEKTVGEAIRKALPDIKTSLSSEVVPEFKEYERMSTVAINAFVSPVMSRYLRNLQDSILEQGIDSGVHIMQSNGGTMGADTAVEKPVHTILSGPAAGVIGSVGIAAQTGESNTISVDMGGTSFDVCLSYKGEIRRTQDSEIERLPIKVPMVDIHTLGAGGGSIAWIDPGGAMRVGPRSAGADPGPACYAQGGVDATVTDANLLLGRLGPGSLLGGHMQLDVGMARTAIEKFIAEPLGIDVEEAAEGIIRVVNAGMIKGIRVVSVAKGYDPREFTLVTFGGAGPLHGAELAAEMDIPSVLVPIAPGVTSAMGLLMADLRHDLVRTVLLSSVDATSDFLSEVYADLEKTALGQMHREGVQWKEVSLIRTADVRYLGQGYELEVPVLNGPLSDVELDTVYSSFHDAHTQAYGYASPESRLELVNLRVTALTKLPQPRLEQAELTGEPNPARALREPRDVIFYNRPLPSAVYSRANLIPGDILDGPAIVEQLDSTTVIWPDQKATIDQYGNILLGRIGK